MSFFDRARLYWRRSEPVVRGAVVQGIGLAGFFTFIEGVRRVHEPSAMIVGGGLVVAWTILKVRSTP